MSALLPSFICFLLSTASSFFAFAFSAAAAALLFASSGSTGCFSLGAFGAFACFAGGGAGWAVAATATGLAVAVAVAVAVAGFATAVTDGLTIATGLAVAVAVTVGLAVAVAVPAGFAVAVATAVAAGLAVAVAVAVAAGLAVAIAVATAVAGAAFATAATATAGLATAATETAGLATAATETAGLATAATATAGLATAATATAGLATAATETAGFATAATATAGFATAATAAAGFATAATATAGFATAATATGLAVAVAVGGGCHEPPMATPSRSPLARTVRVHPSGYRDPRVTDAGSTGSSLPHHIMWWLRPTEASIAIGHQRAGERYAAATKPRLVSLSRANRRSASVAPLVSDGGDPAVSELDLMERSLRIERAARARAEQAARHANAAIATAETLREATVKAAAIHLEAGMARQERLLKRQAELSRELHVVSQVCKDSEALAGESSYARQIGRLKAQLHVTQLPLGSLPPSRGGLSSLLVALCTRDDRDEPPSRAGPKGRGCGGREAWPRSPIMRC